MKNKNKIHLISINSPSNQCCPYSWAVMWLLHLYIYDLIGYFKISCRIWISQFGKGEQALFVFWIRLEITCIFRTSNLTKRKQCLPSLSFVGLLLWPFADDGLCIRLLDEPSSCDGANNNVKNMKWYYSEYRFTSCKGFRLTTSKYFECHNTVTMKRYVL